MAKKRVLVTGATGFIGKNLVVALLKKGTRVVCLARRSSSPESISFLEQFGAEFRYGDLTDADSLKGVAKGIDVVFHLAARLQGTSKHEPAFYALNASGTENIVSEAKRAKVKRFVHMSTVGVYGPAEDADESTLMNPVSVYERTKAAAEHPVRDSGLDYVIVRAGSIFGPYDEQFRQSFTLANRGIAPVIGGARAVIQPLYVKDLIRILVKLLDSKVKNEVVIAAGDERLSVREFVERLAPDTNVRFVSLPKAFCVPIVMVNDRLERILGINLVMNSQLYSVFTKSRTYDISKLKRMFRLTFTPLKKAIAESREWYLS